MFSKQYMVISKKKNDTLLHSLASDTTGTNPGLNMSVNATNSGRTHYGESW